MKKITTIIIVLIILLFNIKSTYANTPPQPQIKGTSGIAMDYDTGQILYAKNIHKRVYPASTTKVLTAILALEKGNLDDIVTANKDVENVDGSVIYLKEGEKLTLRQLLYAMLLDSANDAAVDIADYIGGSVPNFAKLMNEKAKEIGAKDSHFVTPNGLPNKDHYVTAYDMALIARYAMNIPQFREFVKTVTYTIPPTNKFNQKRVLLSTNFLIRPTRYHYEGADGIKTGYTEEANKCLISTAVRDGRRVIVAIYNDDPNIIWQDSTNLLNYSFQNFRNREFIAKGTYVGKSPVDGGKTFVDLYAQNGFKYTLPVNEYDSVKTETVINPAKTPVKPGQKLGYIYYKLNGKQIGRVDLITNQSIKSNFWGDLYDNDNKKVASGNYIQHTTKWAFLGIPILLIGTWLIKRKNK